MKQRQGLAVLLIVVLGVSLHLSIRRLGRQLPEIFPEISRESVTYPHPNPPLNLRGGKGGDIRPDRQSLFEVSSELAPIVAFWRQIYAAYDTNQVVFHDAENLGVYKILNLTGLEERTRDRTIRDELARLRSLHGETVRVQAGLRDRFLDGLQRSQRMMPAIEEIFRSYGLPREISRLAFVESLFNERAVSKAGAAGLWQFMPGTARRYMTVNHQTDERFDPILSTHGAARLLRKNFELLGSWPLAINAYNSGPANLQRAIATLGSRDIGRIITGYKGGSYAFASRNFYPSFLAALEVYEKYREKLTDAVQPSPDRTQTVSDYDADSPERVIQYPSPLQSRIKTTDISTSLQ